MSRGLFIAFEGIDGCGKSTQLALAAAALKRDGYAVLTTREPGGTPIAEKIRSLILDRDNHAMADRCELLLYAAARAQHVQERIAPALAQGIHVLCDRFHYATFAYQGYGRNLPLDLLATVNECATGGILPDLSFIFDISVSTASARLSAMNKPPDRIEALGDGFFSRIAEGYRLLARKYPDTSVLLDGEQDAEALSCQVHSSIRTVLDKCR
ncbi:MAG: dTMP kinase [Chitinispirillaceae bacterium]|jgi:dTMP kinase|nr:dTMP kinase [Chitinispirillaceae bacterium]